MLEPVDIAFRINDGELEIQSRRAVNAILGVGEAGSETEQGVSGLERKLKGLLAGFAGTAAIGNFIRQVVNVRAEMQALEQSFAVLLGSEEKAVAMLADLKQFEIESPLDTKAVAQGAQMMLAFGVEADKVTEIIRRIGDVSMGSTEKFQSLVLSFSQMNSIGHLISNDVRQMATAGFNPLAEMARTTGKSMEELNAQMADGAISAEMVADAFRSATSEGGQFYGMTQKQAEGISGLQAQLGGALREAFNEIGESQEGIIAGGYKMATTMVENYDRVGKLLAALITAYGTYRAALFLVTAATKMHVTEQVRSSILDARGAAIMTTRTVANRSYTASLWAQIGATRAGTAAQAAFNTVAKANPYVLLAAAAVGLVSAMWALKDSTSAEERALKEYGAEREAAAQKEQEHKSKIEQLIHTVNDEAAATWQRVMALNDLQREYPSIFRDYDIEKLKLADIIELKRQIAELDGKRSLQDLRDQAEEIRRQIKEQEKIKNRESIGREVSFNEMNSAPKKIEILNEKLQQYNRQIEEQSNAMWEANTPLELRRELTQQHIDALGKENSQLDEQITKQKKLNESGNILEYRNTSPDEARFNANKKRIEELEARQKQMNSSVNQDAIIKSKTYWDNIKKEAEEARSKLDPEDTKTKAKWDEYTKKIAEADARLKKFDTSSGTSDTKVQREVQARTDALLWLSGRERERENERERAALEAEEKLLETEQEGWQKRFDQNNLNYRKELLAIREQAAKKEKEAKTEAEKIYISEQGHKIGFGFEAFDMSKLPEGLRPEAIVEWQREAEAEAKKIGEANAANLLKGLLDQYQDYTTERRNLEKKFNDDIAVLQDERKKAEAAGNTELVKQLESAIAQATKEKGKSLISMDFDVLKENPDYVRAFENLKNTSTETLTVLLEQLEAMKGKAAEVLDPGELREYVDTVESIVNELASRNPFRALANAQNDLGKSSKALAEARRDLLAAQKDGDPEKLEKAQTAYRKALDDTAKANRRVLDSQEEVNRQMEDLYGALANVGEAIGGQAGEIITLIADIGSFVSTTIDGVKMAAQAGATALSTVEKASAILAIIQIAIQLIDKISKMLPSAYAEYEKYAEKLGEINKLTDAVNEYEVAVAKAGQAEEQWFSGGGVRQLRDAWKINEKATSAYFDKLNEEQAAYQNKSGGGWGGWWLAATLGAHGMTFTANKLVEQMINSEKYAESATTAIENLRIVTQKASSGFLGSGIGGHSEQTQDLREWIRSQPGLSKYGELFDKNGFVNGELAKVIINTYGNKLAGETKETLEKLVELKEQYDEYMGELREYVSSLYAPVIDNMVDALWDWLDGGKSALDSFREYAGDTFRNIVSDLMKSIVLKNVVGTFSDDIAALYERYAEGRVDEMTLASMVSDRVSALTDDYAHQLPALQKMLESINDGFGEAGINLKNIADEATSGQEKQRGGFETLSQETGEFLLGQFTAIRIHVSDIRDLIGGMFLERGELASYLTDIVTNTGNTVKELQTVNGHLRRVVTEGVRAL